jgi:hypothetical protein
MFIIYTRVNKEGNMPLHIISIGKCAIVYTGKWGNVLVNIALKKDKDNTTLPVANRLTTLRVQKQEV